MCTLNNSRYCEWPKPQNLQNALEQWMRPIPNQIKSNFLIIICRSPITTTWHLMVDGYLYVNRMQMTILMFAFLESMPHLTVFLFRMHAPSIDRCLFCLIFGSNRFGLVRGSCYPRAFLLHTTFFPFLIPFLACLSFFHFSLRLPELNLSYPIFL